MRQSASDQPKNAPVPEQTLETPQNKTNKSLVNMNNPEAMEGLLLDKSGKDSKKKTNAKAAAKAQGSTDTCGCSIF